MPRQARFIVLEGGEGLGKSTNLDWMRALLDKRGIPVTITREPGGTEFGEKLRALLLDAQAGAKIRPDAELLLMFAARAQHLQEVIRPALEAGTWVICDRFTDASYAYQGGGRGLPWEHIAYLEHWIQNGLYPDLVLLFDAPVEVGLARAARRSVAADRFEREDREFFRRVREAYLARAALSPERYCIVDVDMDLSGVQGQIRNVLEPMLAEWGAHAV